MLAILRYLVRCKSLKASVKIATITIPRFLFFSFYYCTGLFLFLFFACLFFFNRGERFLPQESRL